MDVKSLLGKNIRELRIKNDMTQIQLAEITGIDSKHLSSIELGKHMPNSQLLLKFANAFNIEIKDLFEFYHLQPELELKTYLHTEIDKLNAKQLESVCKYVRSFVI